MLIPLRLDLDLWQRWIPRRTDFCLLVHHTKLNLFSSSGLSQRRKNARVCLTFTADGDKINILLPAARSIPVLHEAEISRRHGTLNSVKNSLFLSHDLGLVSLVHLLETGESSRQSQFREILWQACRTAGQVGYRA